MEYANAIITNNITTAENISWKGKNVIYHLDCVCFILVTLHNSWGWIGKRLLVK